MMKGHPYNSITVTGQDMDILDLARSVEEQGLAGLLQSGQSSSSDEGALLTVSPTVSIQDGVFSVTFTLMASSSAVVSEAAMLMSEQVPDAEVVLAWQDDGAVERRELYGGIVTAVETFRTEMFPFAHPWGGSC